MNRLKDDAADTSTPRSDKAGHLSRAAVGAGSCVVAVAVAASITIAPTVNAAPVASQSPAAVAATVAPYVPPSPADFSAMSWTDAFRALNDKFSREYAFTKWKHINWRALYRTYSPKIAAAQAANDLNAYYLALRGYIHELRDGHVSITDVPQVAQELAGGGTGLILAKLDNGTVAVTWVQRGGPAALAGVKVGARVLRWNGKPIDKALSATSTVLSPSQPTTARKVYEQLRYLTRGPVGAKKTLKFQNRGKAAKQVVLTALDDNMLTLQRTDSSSIIKKSGWPKKMVTNRIIKGNIGYVKIKAEINLPPQLPGDHTPTLEQFRLAINGFIKAKVKGIIVDVRSNSGGSDQMVADFMSSFYSKKALYEYASYIVPATGTFQIWKLDEATGQYRWPGRGIVIQPAAKRYSGPVVALVDNGCVSSGEGVAMGIKNLPRSRVVGFMGTNGSFGMVGDAAGMPPGLEVSWPFGQSLNKNKVVQVDSRDGRGGVMPNVRVPMTLQNAVDVQNGRDVVLAYGLRTIRAM
ncbi:MAG: S41 family peptidase [Actinomycetes bacterium]